MHQSTRRRQGAATEDALSDGWNFRYRRGVRGEEFGELASRARYSEPDGANHFVRTDDALSRAPNFWFRPDGYDLRQPHESKSEFGI
jgi:hypothetical protein